MIKMCSLQPNKEVNVEKSFRMDEEDAAKPKLTETRKVSLIVTDRKHCKWYDIVLIEKRARARHHNSEPPKSLVTITSCAQLSP